MGVRGILLLLVLLSGEATCLAQKDSIIFLPNKLVVSNIKHPAHRLELDTSGMISIVYVMQRDSLILQRDRSLTGRLVHYTDSSMVLHVQEELIVTQYRNGKNETFYYNIVNDSVKLHTDTIYFNQIHSLRFNKGKHRQLIRIMQGTAYTYVIGNLVALTALFVTTGKYQTFSTTRNLLNVSIFSFSAGASSYLFYPKSFRLHNHPRKKKRIHWRIEVV